MAVSYFSFVMAFYLIKLKIFSRSQPQEPMAGEKRGLDACALVNIFAAARNRIYGNLLAIVSEFHSNSSWFSLNL